MRIRPRPIRSWTYGRGVRVESQSGPGPEYDQIRKWTRIKFLTRSSDGLKSSVWRVSLVGTKIAMRWGAREQRGATCFPSHAFSVQVVPVRGARLTPSFPINRASPHSLFSSNSRVKYSEKVVEKEGEIPAKRKADRSSSFRRVSKPPGKEFRLNMGGSGNEKNVEKPEKGSQVWDGSESIRIEPRFIRVRFMVRSVVKVESKGSSLDLGRSHPNR
ncbi:Uncharacterized protein Rs2_44902 [Raphanus sativus]|nr:Uncharacterized protein Rs2_44902 [Raphanus sativus]